MNYAAERQVSDAVESGETQIIEEPTIEMVLDINRPRSDDTTDFRENGTAGCRRNLVEDVHSRVAASKLSSGKRSCAPSKTLCPTVRSGLNLSTISTILQRVDHQDNATPENM
jgi:hypothetical protein